MNKSLLKECFDAISTQKILDFNVIIAMLRKVSVQQTMQIDIKSIVKAQRSHLTFGDNIYENKLNQVMKSHHQYINTVFQP